MYDAPGRVLDLDVDRNALSNTLGHHAEVLELGEAAIEMADMRGLGTKADRDVDARDAKPTLLVACDPRNRIRGKRSRILLELSHREQETRRQAVRHRGRDKTGSIGAFIFSERSRFIDDQ